MRFVKPRLPSHFCTDYQDTSTRMFSLVKCLCVFTGTLQAKGPQLHLALLHTTFLPLRRFPTGIQCAVASHRALLSACACAGCPKGPWGQSFSVDIRGWHGIPACAPDRDMCGALERPRAQVQWLLVTGQVIRSILTKLQNKEYMIETSAGRSPSSLATRRHTSLRSGDLLSLM